MKAFIVTCLLSTLSLIGLHSSAASQKNEALFTSPELPFSSIQEPKISKIIDFNYSIKKDRVFLNWTVDENQETDQFEIERSVDGKNFIMAALVFGTDKADIDNYEFYEKPKSKKIYYRIRLLQKDHTESYSDIIIVQSR